MAGLCEEDAVSLVRQKTCLLMAAAASLKEATDSTEHTHKVTVSPTTLLLLCQPAALNVHNSNWQHMY